jgi:hypothetical protein
MGEDIAGAAMLLNAQGVPLLPDKLCRGEGFENVLKAEVILQVMLSQSGQRVEVRKAVAQLTLVGALIAHLAEDQRLEVILHVFAWRSEKFLFADNAYSVQQQGADLVLGVQDLFWRAKPLPEGCVEEFPADFCKVVPAHMLGNASVDQLAFLG